MGLGIYQQWRRCRSIFSQLLAGGLEYSLEAPAQFHQQQFPPPLATSLPKPLQPTTTLTEWVTVSLLADGDLSLIISDDYYRQLSPEAVEKGLTDLLATIKDDIDFFNAFILRLIRWLEWTTILSAFMLSIASTFTSFFACTGNVPWKIEPLQVDCMDYLALILLVMAWFRKPIVITLLRHVFKWLSS